MVFEVPKGCESLYAQNIKFMKKKEEAKEEAPADPAEGAPEAPAEEAKEEEQSEAPAEEEKKEE